jgi:hypothetical protein
MVNCAEHPPKRGTVPEKHARLSEIPLGEVRGQHGRNNGNDHPQGLRRQRAAIIVTIRRIL